MKKILSALLVAALLGTLAVSASAVEWTYDAEKDQLDGSLTVLKGTPVVDGVMDDIYLQSDNVGNLPENEPTWSTGLTVDTASSSENYLLWDENYLYIYGICTDNTPLVTNDDFDQWCHDGFEWEFKAANGEFEGNAFLRLRAAGTIKNSEGKILKTEDSGIIYMTAPTDAGWNYEIAIPLPNLVAGMVYNVTCCQVIDIYESMALDIVAKGVQPTPDWIAANSNGKKGYTNLFVNLSDEAVKGAEVETEPEPETEAETVEEKVDTPAADAPQTFDAGIIAAVAAIVSAAGYAISKKR